MNAKEFIIQKLVKAGKKHRWMKYPMLALVSLVSLFFLLIERCMKKPKRAIVALVCFVLIISQSWYLISMAGDGDVEESYGNESSQEVSDGGEIGIPASEENDILPDTAGSNYSIKFDVGSYGISIDDKTVTLSELQKGVSVSDAYPSATYDSYYKFDGWYKDTQKVTGSDGTTTVDINLFKNNTDSITLEAKWVRKAFALTFSPVNADTGYSATVIPVSIGDSDSTATADLSTYYDKNGLNYIRTGYTFSYWKNTADNSLVDLKNTSYQISADTTLVPEWVANKYTINFKSQEDDMEGQAATGAMDPITATYDVAVNLTSLGFTKEGYRFTGWRLTDGSGTAINDSHGNAIIYNNMESVSNLTNVENGAVTLVAQWTYDVADFDVDSVESTYGNTLSADINIKHSQGEAGTFTATLAGVSGSTIDGTAVTQDNFTAVTGIQISYPAGENKIHFESGSILTVGEFVLSFNVTDTVNNKTTPIDATVRIGKRELSIDSVTFTEKTYDGTNTTGVGSISFSGQKTGDDVRVLSNGVGTFGDENAGENKLITISGIELVGTASKYYTAVSTKTLNTGVIKKSTAYVTTSAEETTILTGETPVYTVEVSDKGLPADSTKAAKDKEKIIAAVKKHILCAYGTPDYAVGSYAINIDVDAVNSELNNYDISTTPGSLTVEQKNPVLNTDYKITGDLSEDGSWYYGYAPYVEVLNKEDYDSVYVMTDASSKASHCDKNDARFMNKGEITQEISNHDEVYIQLGNKATGAVSDIKRITIKVDTTAPTVTTDSISIRSVNQTTFSKIGNFLSFGNFFKEELEVSVPIKDETTGSGEKAVIYYLIPDGSTADSAEGVLVTVGSNATATFTIPKNFSGQIMFVAQDKAGNKSGKAGLIGVEGSTVNYWVIENTAPAISIEAYDAEGNHTSSAEGNYYKKVTAAVTVEDSQAGVNHIVWNITKNGEPVGEAGEGIYEAVETSDSLLTSYKFQKLFEESGTYTISAVAYDNATNQSLTSDTLTFVIDATAPNITVEPEEYDTSWATSKTIQFSLEDTESGINYFVVKAKTESGSYDNTVYPYTSVAKGTDVYSFVVTEKGIYNIIAEDNAGNRTEVPLTIQKVSEEIPDDPEVTFAPEIPDDVEAEDTYWFTSNPVITITEPEYTPDGTGITTYYRLWKDGTTEPYQNSIVNGTLTLPDEGVYNLRVWAVTESGQINEKEELYRIHYDSTAPVVSDILLQGSGTGSKISFKVEEATSGLAKLEAIYNPTTDGEGTSQTLSFDYEGSGVYSANFTAALKGGYAIKATDAAGNVGFIQAVEPMTIQVSSVTGNAVNGITVAGTIYAGTYDIDSVSVFYGLESESDQTVAADDLILVKQDSRDVAFTAKFKQLQPNTRYLFKVTASSESGEVCNYTGAFKTGSENASGISLTGSVIDMSIDSASDSYLTVALSENSSVIQTLHVRNNSTFTFDNVEDGTYTIQASNDNRVASVGVIVRNGTIIEPTSPIQLILRNGESTSVEYESEDVPRIVVSGLENIFDDTTNFGSDSDYAVINNGGTVEFCMKVKALSASSVPQADMNLLRKNMASNETVAMYLDLSIYKRVYNAYGLVSENQVTAINGGKTVRVVIPLSTDVASKNGLSVIRVHEGAVDRLADIDTNAYTYSFQSSLYSTYALVYAENNGSSATSTSATNTSTNNTGATNSTSSTSNTGSTSDKPNSTTATASSGNGSTSGTVKKGSSYSPSTGDSSPVMLAILVMMLSLVSGFVFLQKKTKGNR